jgi:hypothetical protein
MGRESVCSCQFDGQPPTVSGSNRSARPTGGKSVANIEAGPQDGVASNLWAKDKCTKICERAGRTWAGTWDYGPGWRIRWTCACSM